MYKIETHLHTLYGAGCGKMEEKEIVSRYLDAGYAAVVVTDHYNRRTNWYPEFCADRSQNAAVLFLRGFRKVQEEGARRGLRVYKGAELRFDESINDFLLYNYDDALLEDPEELLGMGLERFYERASAQGALLLQAHPPLPFQQPAALFPGGYALSGRRRGQKRKSARGQSQRSGLGAGPEGRAPARAERLRLP